MSVSFFHQKLSARCAVTFVVTDSFSRMSAPLHPLTRSP